MVQPLTRSVGLAGPSELNSARLTSLSGEEEISRPFRFELRLQADGLIDADKVLGKPVGVQLTIDGKGTKRFFHGVLTEFAHVGFGERYHEYYAVLRPAFWLLTRRADCRVLQNMSVPDMFADVCRSAGFNDHRSTLNAAHYEKWEYRVQYRESDFDFLSRLLEQEGIYYYFEHSKDRHELVLADDVGKLTSVDGYANVPYFPPTNPATQRTRDNLSSFSVMRSFQPGAFASREYDFEHAASDIGGASSVAGRKDSSRFELFEYPSGATKLTAAGVERIAKLRAQQLQVSQSVARAGGDCAGLTPGRVFTLTDHPQKDLNKKYLVVSARYELRSDEAQSVGISREPTRSQEPQFQVSLDAVDAHEPYRPARLTPKPLIQGTQTGFVVGSGQKDQEIWTDKFGRVKVQFHWDRAGHGHPEKSCWVRVAQGWAGRNWGMQHVPRIGQEVVVSFLDGDPDRPLVIGSVYNSESMPPYALPDMQTQSGVKSRSSASGTAENFNELRFEDKKGSEEIYLHAEKDMQVIVENNQTISVGATKKDKGDRTTTIQHDDKLKVGNDLTVEITGKETHTITKDRATSAKESDALTVGKKYTLTAADQITLECGLAKIVLKKDGTVEISGKDVKLTGTMKATVDATQTAIFGTQVDVKGTKTAVQGSGTLDLASSGIASLKGSLTKIG
ncbi:MAG: type VI secretion system tip protein TssI/VgrG [Gammaproteobacteria bacterium]